MAKSSKSNKPNILIIWGDDIGHLEPQLLLARRDGLPHAQHRPRRQGRHAVHRLLRRAELHRGPRVVHHRPKRISHRPDQSRHARRRRSACRRKTRPSPSCSSRSATRRASSARTTWATGTSILPTVHGFDEFYGNLYHLNAEEEPEDRRLPAEKDFPRVQARSTARAACSTAGRPTRTTPTEEPRSASVGKQKIEDTGPLTKKRMETIDDEIADGGDGLHQAAARGRQAVLRLGELHRTCTAARTPSRRASGQAGRWQSPVPRRDDRPRQERRHGARRSRRARASRTTRSSCTPPTTART